MISFLHAEVLVLAALFLIIEHSIFTVLAEFIRLRVEVIGNTDLEKTEDDRTGESILFGLIVRLVSDSFAILLRKVITQLLSVLTGFQGGRLGILGEGLAVLRNEDSKDDDL